jgi:uncharacterized protein YycO
MKAYISVVRSNQGFYDRVIKWYSRSPYVHAEFHWPLDAKHPSSFLGAQPKGGVAIRPSNYLREVSRDTFVADLSAQQFNNLQTWLLEQCGKPYDFRAIAGMALQFLDKYNGDSAWFCSELVYYGLANVGFPLLREPMNEADTITPRDVAVSLQIAQVA